MTVLDWPPLAGLRALPHEGATLDELAAELQASPLWTLLPTMDRARFERLIVALNRAGLTWLAMSLVLARKTAEARWAKRPGAMVGEVLTLDAAALLRGGMGELVRRGWYELDRSRYSRASVLRTADEL